MEAVAEPGSGKTLGYLLPCIAQLLDANQGADSPVQDSPAILILTPTRQDLLSNTTRKTACQLGFLERRSGAAPVELSLWLSLSGFYLLMCRTQELLSTDVYW